MIITALKTFENAGVWRDYKDTDRLQFAPKTLIYGFNGSGKTTLARAFDSVGRAEIEPKLPSTASFSIELSDGNTVSSKTLTNPFAGSLLVFNQDFIERNFQWDDSKAEGIAYISELSVSKKAEYDAALKTYSDSEVSLDLAKKEKSAADKAHKDFKTIVSRRVRELAPSKRYTQSYNAKNIDLEYAKREFTADDIISEEELGIRQKLLVQDEALPLLKDFPNIDIDIKKWVSDVFEILGMTPGSVLSKEFQTHSEALTWVHEGLKYHKKHNLETCLFCGSLFTEDRKNELEGNFDSAWDTFVSQLNQANDQCIQYIQQFRVMYQAIPKEPEIQAAEQKALKVLRPVLITSITSLGQFLNSVSELLQKKLTNPSVNLPLPDSVGKFDVINWMDDCTLESANLKGIISKHNKAHEDFSTQQNTAFEVIKNHVLSSEREKNSEVKTALIEAAKADKLAQESFSTARQTRDKLNNELSNHGIGAKKLNDLLAMYLGHRDIQLNSLDIGYQLVRADGKPAEHLSEGEKTALAFCYFLTQFAAENRVLKDLVVVIDDPVSSLDTSARTHAFSLMSRMTKKCAQTIIFTHNMSFMNMVKREFQNLQNRNTKKYVTAFLSLDCTCDSNDLNNRSTKLIEMSSLLQKYDTEYQYLFDMVQKTSQEQNSPHHYLLPNAIRKLLEMFTAFCSPNQTNFIGALMEHHKALKDKIDIRALERLIQIESHGSLDGLGNLPTLTIEEVIRAAEAAMLFIKELAPRHFKAMQKCL